MQVFTRIEIEPDGSISRADWYNYIGPVAACKGDVSYPAPSKEEKALQQEQADLLRSQNDMMTKMFNEQNLLAPYLYKEAGLSPTYDESGNITGFSQIADPNAALSKQVETGLLQRSLDALQGNLPVDPALERELSQQEDVLRNTLRNQLGSGWETSTPGIQKMDEFMRSAAQLREGARRGDLTLAEQLGLARSQSNEAQVTETMNRLFGTSGLPARSLASGSQISSGYSQLLSSYANDRAMQLQANIANAQMSSNAFGSIMGVLGTGAGLAGGYALMKM